MYFRRKYLITIVFIIVLSLITVSVVNAASSPFNSLWRATDIDGSNVQLSIAGGGQGIFRLILTDDYWSLCEGDPGIGKGVGFLDNDDPNILHTEWVMTCTSQHESQEFQFDAVYNPDDDTLDIMYVQWYRVRH